MKTGILFDLDGTLLDTLEDLHNAVNHTLQTHGYPTRTRREIRSFLGNGMRNLIKASLPAGTEEETVDRVLGDYQHYYDSHNDICTRPYDGILQALAVIKETYPIGVVSNKQDTAVKPLCRTFFGEDVYACGETPDCPRKPAPDMIFRAMQALGVGECIYVGDSEVDLKVAENAGLPCLLVTWGFRDREHLQKAGGKHFCDQPETMPRMLAEMVNRYYGK